MSRSTDRSATGDCPSLPWRALSATTIFGVAALCRSLEPYKRVRTYDAPRSLRRHPSATSTKLTVVSDSSSMDDPIMWGAIPLRWNFGLSSSNKRWGFGSHDICYQSRPLALFFTMGQVLPTHRLAHSPYGGLAQPAVTQAIRLLSKGPFPPDPHLPPPERQHWSLENICVDPFSDLPTAYTTTGMDSHLAPSAYACNSYSWVHIFPEGKIHQAPNKTMRYFKWGVARLILEANECPDIVPIWLEGFDQVMHESRGFPRFLPRVGKDISITFGKKVDSEAVFGDMRRRWREIKAKAESASPETRNLPLGVLSDELLHDEEAVELRKEVTKKVRDLVLEVRRTRGLSDEDPKHGLAETWIEEGPQREGKMKDESWSSPALCPSPGEGAKSSVGKNKTPPAAPTPLRQHPTCFPFLSVIIFSMPKKHHKHSFAKPVSPAHHTLISSGPRNQNERFHASQASSSSASTPSVNDLINHLRRTQVSRSPEDGAGSPTRFVAPRSVHPSLRNLLELPETPPPRPRPEARRVGVTGRRLRRTPGPPPPQSWLLGSHDNDTSDEDLNATNAARVERIIYRLDRLPGTTFPRKSDLLHMVLKTMASQWAWHIEYDGQFLAVLPSHVKILLLSYIAGYARDQPLKGLMHGLKPLFEKFGTDGYESGDAGDIAQDGDSEVSRLDLSSALGRWMTIKQLSRELLLSNESGASPAQGKAKKPVPSSWEEIDDEDELVDENPNMPIPKALSQGLRFQNLRFLSLAHPKPAAANWNSLVDLLSRLSTITHLSLAHWPLPTVTPNAMNTRIRHPTQRSLTFAYGGTDSYTGMENNWAEAAAILRRVSRVTYCLKWLDLEGCGDWIPALTWEGVSPDGEALPSGPEWNGSWRDIEYIRLGPGWLPHVEDSDFAVPQSDASERLPSSPLRSLASSIHAPSPAPSDTPDLPWDVEVERIKYRRAKELEYYRETLRSAKAVQRSVLQLRRSGRGKWVHFSFGLEGLDAGILKKLLGADYRSFVP
ncbi:lysophosphatidylcholine acyltransferase [Aspergillus lentulus]|uniref:Lysophosphatidylcholine acyltransferase n=1 Tax=Aspergillus lentulus TaxID=293939 RepID=A0AAN4T9I7_ASPLE|nr:lysophosphatidylcholine acyltransferase [Aspergillus lentulus]